MTARYSTDCPHSEAGWCRACVGRLAEAFDDRRDEADRERLARREHERRLDLIKESLRPWFDADGSWDGSLVGLPGIVAGVADRFRDLEAKVARRDERESSAATLMIEAIAMMGALGAENRRLAAELDGLRLVVFQPWIRDGEPMVKINLAWWESAGTMAEARAMVDELIGRVKKRGPGTL